MMIPIQRSETTSTIIGMRLTCLLSSMFASLGTVLDSTGAAEQATLKRKASYLRLQRNDSKPDFGEYCQTTGDVWNPHAGLRPTRPLKTVHHPSASHYIDLLRLASLRGDSEADDWHAETQNHSQEVQQQKPPWTLRSSSNL